jgi:hypothetical protein
LKSKLSDYESIQKNSFKEDRSLTNSVTTKSHLKPTTTYKIKKEKMLEHKSPKSTENGTIDNSHLEYVLLIKTLFIYKN